MRTAEAKAIAKGLKDQAVVLDAEITERERTAKKVEEEDEAALWKEPCEAGKISHCSSKSEGERVRSKRPPEGGGEDL